MKYYIFRGGIYNEEYCMEYVECKYIFKNKKTADKLCIFIKDILDEVPAISGIDYIVEQYFEQTPRSEIINELRANCDVYDYYEELYVRVSEVYMHNETIMETE